MAKEDDDFVAWLERAMEFGFQNFCHGDYRPTILLQLPSGAHMGASLIPDGDLGDVEPDVDEAIEDGRQRIARNSDAQFYAIIWNGHVDDRPDASGGVFVEAGKRTGNAVLVTQPYLRDGSSELTKIPGLLFSNLNCNLWEGKPISTQRIKTRDPQSIEINNLEDVAEEALRMAAERLAQKYEFPFMMFINGAGDIDFVEVRNDAIGDVHQELRDARIVIQERDDAIQYALVTFGMITMDGKKTDAMTVECGDRREKVALLFAKKYSTPKRGGKPKIGKLFVLTHVPSLWNHFDAGAHDDEDSVEEGYVNIDTLEELANHVFDLGARQLTEDCEDPFAFLITKEAEILVHELPLEPGHDVDEVLNDGRKLIAETDDGVMAALVYYATLEVDGRTRDVMVAEVEEREGEALMYAQTYDVIDATDEIEVGEPFVVTEGLHLWNWKKNP